jgi:hypothetical protein
VRVQGVVVVELKQLLLLITIASRKKPKEKDKKETSKPDHAETVTLLAMPDFFCCCSIS